MHARAPFWKVFLLLAIGMLSISFGSIFVKWAQEAPSLTIAFFRMFWAGLILLPFYMAGSRSPGGPPWRPKGGGRESGRPGFRLWIFCAGVALALHFAFWVTSLRYTSVAVSVVLVNTSPILVCAVSGPLLGEKPTGIGLMGIGSAFLGALLLLWGDLQRLGDWRGAALALSGAAALGLYLVAGRRIRQQTHLLDYIYPTYVLAAGLLAILVWVSDAPISGFSIRTHIVLFLLGLVPQCVGHTSYNWALRYLPVTLVSTLVVAEPVLASLLAYWILDEWFGEMTLLGGAGVVLGILLVSCWGTRQPAV